MIHLKAFADDKINLTHIVRFVFRRVENIVAKGKNADYPFPTVFLRSFSPWVVKRQDYVFKG